jgi:hypothetical protein
VEGGEVEPEVGIYFAICGCSVGSLERYHNCVQCIFVLWMLAGRFGGYI